MIIETAKARDIAALARLWHQGWHDAHAGIVPEALTRARTPDSFLTRTTDHIGAMKVVRQEDRLTGFYLLNGEELNQFYLAREARGTGLAAALMTDAETGLGRAGHLSPWLACAIGNARAAHFYANAGWQAAEHRPVHLETTEGPFRLSVRIFRKTLPRTGT